RERPCARPLMPRTFAATSRREPRQARADYPPQKRAHGRREDAMTSRMNFTRLFAVVLTSLMLAASGDAGAADYPTRPVRWIVPYPAGGATDIVARIIGQSLSERLGQQFIIDVP